MKTRVRRPKNDVKVNDKKNYIQSAVELYILSQSVFKSHL